MKIHEYNEMMRYLTRPASPSMDQGPTDDVISQEQKPKTFYPEDSVMPSFDGMEDPKALEDYRQIELADGGVVKREGLNKGIKKLETIINNIGQEKIKAGKLNQNEFNILRKALKSPAAQTAIKYGGKTLKVLGPVLVPIVLYDTYDQYKKGKPLAEILEYGLIGTDFSRDVRKMANYTPEEREALQQAQQYERNEEDISGLSSDFDTPTNLSADEIRELAATGPKRVEDLMLAQDKAKAKKRVYTGAPEIEDYGERVGLKLGTPKKLYDLGKKILKNKEPENPDRRDFLKGAGALGLAVAAFGTGALKIAKALKTKTALKVLAKPAAGQPEWFAPLVDKIITKGIYTKNLDKADSISGTYTFKEGDQTLKLIKTEPETFSNGYTYGGDIRIEAEAGGAFDQPFSMTYFPNIKYVTEGQKVSRPGFQVIESRPRYTAVGPGDFDLEDIEYVHSTGGKDVNLLELPKGETGILSDMEGLEKIATGKIKNPKLKKKRQEVNEKLLKNPTEDRAIEYYDGPDIDYDYD